MIKQPQKTARGKRDITGLNRIMQNKRAVALSLVWQPFAAGLSLKRAVNTKRVLPSSLVYFAINIGVQW